MEQDGRLEIFTANPARLSTGAQQEGTMLMTLYIASEEGTFLRHATVPFQESYEAACRQALKSFVVFVPKNTETVSLRHACRRLDGSVIWSTIHEDDWCSVLKRTGEELGVFLPADNPEKISYGQPGTKMVLFRFYLAGIQMLKTVGSFKECEAIAQTVFNAFENKDRPRLMFDSRMLGSPESQAAHRRERDTSSMETNATWENLHSSAMFEILVNMHPEPLFICVL